MTAPAEAQADKRVLPFATTTFPPPGFVPSSPAAASVASPYRLGFYKTARRIGCDHVSYRIRVQVDMDPGLLADGTFAGSLASTRFDFRDALPAGLTATRVDIAGDVLAASSGIPLQVAASGPVTIPDIRFDPAAFAPGRSSLSFEIDIDARIDRTAFGSPAAIENQAVLEIATATGPYATIGSHDPAYPEDADEFNGIPTALVVDMAGCDTSASSQGTASSTTQFGLARPNAQPPLGGEACFKLVQGELLCSPTGNGTRVYRMPFGPEMSGRTVEFMPGTPGVFVDPPMAVVPNGGGVLEWTIHGARPGMTLLFSTVGHEVTTGPAEGWGICCRQLVEIVVPVEDCPRPERPRLVVQKQALPGRCDPGAAQCTFRITLTNRGTAPHVGELSFTDTIMGGQARIAVAPAAPWQCSATATPTVCRHPATTLAPGQSISVDLTLDDLSTRRWNQALNCARIDGQIPRNARRRSDVACAFGSTPPPKKTVNEPPRLKLEKKTLSPVCSASGVCRFAIEVTNIGGTPHRGPVSLDDQLAYKNPKKIRISPADRWNCQIPQAGRLSCRTRSDAVLPPRAVMTLLVEVTVDPALAASANGGMADVTNCAALRDSAGGAGPQSCATAKIRIPKIEKPPIDVPPAPVPPPPVIPRGAVGLPPPVPTQELPRNLPPPVPSQELPRNLPPPVAPPSSARQAPVCVIPGQVLNAAGRCVCEAGTTYDPRTRSCTGGRTPPAPAYAPAAPTYRPAAPAYTPPAPAYRSNAPTQRYVPARPSRTEPVRPSKRQSEKQQRPPREVKPARPAREQQRRPDNRRPQQERPRRDPDAGRKVLEGILNGLGNNRGEGPRRRPEPLD
ncbi:DUF7929 domain-containing protein [Pinisolibacter sp.]|uniref:DUF7929 domain-containing protein n=1 Tax=Pinisolibacter sp. TaxID=2172024 RepID=UPI002FDDB38A